MRRSRNRERESGSRSRGGRMNGSRIYLSILGKRIWVMF